VHQLAAIIADLDELVERDPSAQGILADHRPSLPQREIANQREIGDLLALGIDEDIAAVAKMEEIKGHARILAGCLREEQTARRPAPLTYDIVI
jgi:hypothetical protein